jgi:hypothetical protein
VKDKYIVLAAEIVLAVVIFFVVFHDTPSVNMWLAYMAGLFSGLCIGLVLGSNKS